MHNDDVKTEYHGSHGDALVLIDCDAVRKPTSNIIG